MSQLSLQGLNAKAKSSIPRWLISCNYVKSQRSSCAVDRRAYWTAVIKNTCSAGIHRQWQAVCTRGLSVWLTQRCWTPRAQQWHVSASESCSDTHFVRVMLQPVVSQSLHSKNHQRWQLSPDKFTPDRRNPLKDRGVNCQKFKTPSRSNVHF